MCRHIYDWNIDNCDVKQPFHFISYSINDRVQKSQSWYSANKENVWQKLEEVLTNYIIKFTTHTWNSWIFRLRSKFPIYWVYCRIPRFIPNALCLYNILFEVFCCTKIILPALMAMLLVAYYPIQSYAGPLLVDTCHVFWMQRVHVTCLTGIV